MTRSLDLRGGRFRPLTWNELTTDQQTMAAALLNGQRPSLDGPFNALLRSPEMGNLAQKLGEYIRFRSSVPRRLNELAILMTAQWWSSQFEWHAHARFALDAGLSAAVIEDLQAGRRPAAMAADEVVVYDFCTELRRDRKVSDATYAAVQKLFGDQGVVDLIGVNGYYDLVSMTLNTARVATPPDGALPLPDLKP